MTLDAPLQSPLESRTSLRYPWTRYLDKCIRWGCGVALGIAALTQRTAFSAVTTATSERWLSLMLVPGIKSCDHRSVSAKSDHFTVSMSSEESVVRHAARTRMPHRTCGDRNLPTVQESITRTSATDAIARVWGRPRLERNTRDKPLAYGTSRRTWGKLRTCPLSGKRLARNAASMPGRESVCNLHLRPASWSPREATALICAYFRLIVVHAL
jgi:hypothetical protein